MPDSLRMCMAANPSRVSCMDGDVGGLVGGKVGTHPNSDGFHSMQAILRARSGKIRKDGKHAMCWGWSERLTPGLGAWRLARDLGFDPQRRHGWVFASENRSASSNQVERDYRRRICIGWRRWASPRLVNMAHSWIAVDRWGGHSKGVSLAHGG
jgi:hypothetical protein